MAGANRKRQTSKRVDNGREQRHPGETRPTTPPSPRSLRRNCSEPPKATFTPSSFTTCASSKVYTPRPLCRRFFERGVEAVTLSPFSPVGRRAATHLGNWRDNYRRTTRSSSHEKPSPVPNTGDRQLAFVSSKKPRGPRRSREGAGSRGGRKGAGESRADDDTIIRVVAQSDYG